MHQVDFIGERMCQLHIRISHQLCKAYRDCDKMHVHFIHTFTTIWLFYLALCFVNTTISAGTKLYCSCIINSITLSHAGEREKCTNMPTHLHCISLQPSTGMKGKPGTDSCMEYSDSSHSLSSPPQHTPPIY